MKRFRTSHATRTLLLAVTAALQGNICVSTLRASVLFDNISAHESGTPPVISPLKVNYSSSLPDTFMGDGYVLAPGATEITGLDLFPINESTTNFQGLQLDVYIWGTVNTGTVNASSPAFSNLLGTYSTDVSGNYSTGYIWPFEGSPVGANPNFTFATPLQLNGITTIGVTFEYEGTTDGISYNTSNKLTSLISFGVAPTVGSDVFNGYYRNANSEVNGNFNSSLKSLTSPDNVDQSIALRIFGDIATNQWTANSGANWTTASNWSNYVVPTSTTDAAFNLSLPGDTVTVSSAGACKDLYVQSDRVTLNFSSPSSSLAIGGVLSVGQPATSGGSVSGILDLTNSSGGGSANVSAASLIVGGNGSTGQLTIGGSVNLSIAGAVSIANGSSIAISSGGKLYASNASISGSTDAWTGLLDIGTSALDLPIGDLATVSNQVKEGYNAADGGGWNGPGGITSSAAAGDSNHLTAVGVIVNNDGFNHPLYGSGGSLGPFSTNTPNLNDVLIRYTYFGDANLNGTVDGSDYSQIDNGFINQLTGWYNGDFNYDGVVNGSDYTLIDNAFNTQGAQLTSAISNSQVVITTKLAGESGTAVPEPTSVSFLATMILAVLWRRSNRIR